MWRIFLILAIIGAAAALMWGAGKGVGQAWEKNNPTETPTPVPTTDPTAPISLRPNRTFLVLEGGNLHEVAAGFLKAGGAFVRVDKGSPVGFVGTITVSVGNGTITLYQSGETINATLSETVCMPAVANGQLACTP